jgi:hypothetical protein
MAQANEVASELMRPGLDEAALSRFAALAADRAARCAVTIQRAGVETDALCHRRSLKNALGRCDFFGF